MAVEYAVDVPTPADRFTRLSDMVTALCGVRFVGLGVVSSFTSSIFVVGRKGGGTWRFYIVV